MMKIAGVVLVAACLSAQNAGLGRIEFPTSGPPEAQKHFLGGVLLLHSFEYDDARDEFRTAQKIAPNFAMAYWGEALTYNEPLWFAQDGDAAQVGSEPPGCHTQARLAKAPPPARRNTCERYTCFMATAKRNRATSPMRKP